jgi:hypothetical protein
MNATASSILPELSTISVQAPQMEATGSPEKADSDQMLMERYRDGDATAFNELYRRFRGPLRRFVARLSRGTARGG